MLQLLDNLLPFEPILLPNFFNALTFMLGGQLNILPQREGIAANGKGELSQPEWIGCLGHLRWTICTVWEQPKLREPVATDPWRVVAHTTY